MNGTILTISMPPAKGLAISPIPWPRPKPSDATIGKSCHTQSLKPFIATLNGRPFANWPPAPNAISFCSSATPWMAMGTSEPRHKPS